MSSAFLKQIDELSNSEKHQEIYDQLRRPDGNYSTMPPEILWRFGRAKAYQVDSKYFVLLHCLGAWCYEIAHYSEFERGLSALFFTRPPESSYDEALRYYLESYELNPNFLYTSARIALCYDKLKNKEAAKKWATKALSGPGRDDEAIETLSRYSGCEINMTSDSYLSQIDELYNAERHQEVYDMLRRPNGNYSEASPQILWRFARAIRYLIFTKGKEDKPARKKWLEEGLTAMKMAVEKYPDDSFCNTKAYEVDSKYFVLLHCLGTWCFEIARLSKLEREIASVFFAKPPESSYDEALRYFLESYHINPDLIFTSARIAQCYDKLKNKEAAKRWAERALSKPGRDDEVIEAQEECRKILKNYR
ncbi:hypothetical protein ACTXT7_010799 [Hymenolepis weldensis]